MLRTFARFNSLGFCCQTVLESRELAVYKRFTGVANTRLDRRAPERALSLAQKGYGNAIVLSCYAELPWVEFWRHGGRENSR
jgi:hypothetical protein